MATSTKIVLIGAIVFVALMYWFSFHYMSSPPSFAAVKKKPIEAEEKSEDKSTHVEEVIEEDFSFMDIVVLVSPLRSNQWRTAYREISINLTQTDPDFHNTSDAYNPYFIARDWLPYLLRSLETVFEESRKLYLIVPDYHDSRGTLLGALNSDLPEHRVQVVAYKDFIPQDLLPTFHENTIVANIPNIEGLGDTFMVIKEFCFLNGRPKFNARSIPVLSESNAKSLSHLYGFDGAQSILNSQKLINHAISISPNERKSFETQPDIRGPIIVDKGQFHAVLAEHSSKLEKTLSQKFLYGDSINVLSLYSRYVLKNGFATPRLSDSYYAHYEVNVSSSTQDSARARNAVVSQIQTAEVIAIKEDVTTKISSFIGSGSKHGALILSDDLLRIMSSFNRIINVFDGAFIDIWPKRSNLEASHENPRVVHVGNFIAFVGFFGIPSIMYLITRYFGANKKRRDFVTPN